MEFGIIIFFSLVIAWLTARFVPGKNFGLGGDLLFGLFGSFVRMNLAVTLGNASLLNGIEPTLVMAMWGGSFGMVALTRIYSLIPLKQNIKKRN